MNIDVKKILDEAFEKQKQIFLSVNDYAIEIGVIAGNSKRKKTVSIGITNAELMFIHENGSPLRNIPARPVLEMTIQDAMKDMIPQTVDRIYDGCMNKLWTKEQVKQELEKLCVRMQNHARSIIYRSDRLAPNKPGTIKAKGSDRPLLDTGQLARSITCRLIERSSSENGP